MEQKANKKPVVGEEVCFLPATELVKLMAKKIISPVEVTEAYLARIKRLNPELNAFVYIAEEQARAAAKESEKRYRSGKARLAEGLPFAIKDLFDFWADAPNTFGSVPMKKLGFKPPFTSVYIQRMLDAGVVPLGKTNTPEFGHKGITDNLAYGPTSTPFDTRFNAGGSSGGSAAAAAGFLTALTQGSDAGGSVRIPASMSGIVGFKPSVGRIPQDAPPLAYTPFFTPGPMARTVADTALTMQIMAGPYGKDPLSMPDKLNYQKAVERGEKDELPLRGKKIAYSPNLDIFPVEPTVQQTVEKALKMFKEAGAQVDEVKIGLDKLMIDEIGGKNKRPAVLQDFSDMWVHMMDGLYAHAWGLFTHYGIIDLSEHMSELTPQWADMVRRGRKALAVDYRHMDFFRIDILTAFEAVLEEYDYVISPTLAVLGVENGSDGNTIGPKEVEGVSVDPLIGWCLTYLSNFTGHPSISVPAGLALHPFAETELPVGLHIMGRRWRDDEVFMAAAAFEARQPWYDLYPRS